MARSWVPILLGAFHLLSCAQDDESALFPYVVRIISSERGVYSLDNVTLKTLEDVRTMRGSIGELRGNAALNDNLASDEVIASANPDAIYKHRGSQVQIDFFVKNGIIVPKNFQSMEMLGLYYNLERTIAYWTEKFSIPFAEIGLPGIFYNPKMTRTNSGVTEEVSRVMNAAYIPGVRDLWFFRTSPQEFIPVKMNFGVVAHEFGHFIFDYRFAEFDANAYDVSSPNNERLLSGLNEGLADYFAYMVSGSPREFGNSLSKLEEERSLPVSWTISSLSKSGCRGGFYCEGSVLASALYEIAISPGQSALKVGTLAYEAIPLFAKKWRKIYKTELIDYEAFLDPLIEASGEDKALYCSVILKWFDTEAYETGLPCD